MTLHKPFFQYLQAFDIQVCISLDSSEKALHIVLSLKKFPHLYFYWKAGTLLNVKIIRTLKNGNEVSLSLSLSPETSMSTHFG